MKKYLKRIWSFIKTLFTNPELYIEKYILPSIDCVQAIKKAVDSPLAFVITSIIPTSLDDAIRAKISSYLGVIIQGFTMGLDVLNDEDQDEDKIMKFIVWMQGLSPVLRSAIYAKMAAKLSQISAGDYNPEIKNHSIDLLTQLAYSKLKSGINEDSLSIVKDMNTIEIPRAFNA